MCAMPRKHECRCPVCRAMRKVYARTWNLAKKPKAMKGIQFFISTNSATPAPPMTAESFMVAMRSMLAKMRRKVRR